VIPSEVDEYEFWGIIQKSGVVTPANLEEEIYYPTDVIQEYGHLAEGAIVKINHLDLPGVAEEDLAVGGIRQHKLHDDNLFVRGVIIRQLFENFVETVSDQQNSKIGVNFNDLVREVHAGNLALSAGLRAAYAPTDIHQNTVVHIDSINEVSFVQTPASPGSYAWKCDDQCTVVFGG